MGGEHKYNKYKKRLSIVLLSSMLLTLTEPFIGLTLGVDKVNEISEIGGEVGGLEEGSINGEVTEIDNEESETVNESTEGETPQEENIDKVEIVEESLETVESIGLNDEDTKKENEIMPVEEGIIEENTEDGEEVNTKIRMFGLQSTSLYELADETEFRNPDDYVNGGNITYLGTKQYVEIPSKIYRWNTPTYANMFAGKKVKGVKSTNKSITNMEYMFKDMQSDTLDVSQLYTGSATTMQGMFKGVKVIDLDLSQFNTSMVSNMVEMFRDSKIVYLDVSNFDTTYIQSMERMFQDTEIKNIDISSFNTPRVTNMTGVFSGAKAITINLGELDTSRVTDMKEMFRYTVAKDLDLSSFDTSKVLNMRDMFQESNAEVLDLTSFDTTNVTDMSSMFKGANASRIDVSSFNTENTYNVVSMFQDTKATELDLRNFNTSKITDMNNMFNGSQARKIDVSTFDTTYVTDMSGMFMNTQVEELYLSSFDMGSVNNTTDMFKGTTATKGYARTQRDADILNNSVGKPEHLHFESRYVVPKDTDFQGSTNGSFRYIGKDEYIEMPHVIKEIPVVSYKSMFEGTSVKGVVSTNKNIKDMTRMFYGNTATNLDVSNLNTTGVTTMGSMFEYAHTNKINVQNFDTSKVEYMGYMFKDTKLQNLDLSSFDMVNVKNTDGMFQRSNAQKGYARTKEDAGKLNGSLNKPENLKFTVWSILVKPSTTEWTNKRVSITAKGESEELGIDYIDMVSNGDKGVNLLRNGDFKDGLDYWSLGSNFNRVLDSEGLHITVPKNTSWARLYSNSPVFKNMKKGETYTISYESKTDTTKGRTLNIALGTSIGEIMHRQPMYTAGDWQKQVVTFTTTGDSLSSSDFRLQIWLDHHMNPTESKISFRKFKIERGGTATPFTLAPEDVKLENNQKEYEVSENGTYIFRAVDKSGNTKEVAYTVSNIDYNKPTAELTISPEGWTSKDVSIYINAKDELSGVDYITLPDGTKVNENKAEYKVTENGEYTFKVTDEAGNTETFKKTVNNIDKTVPESVATVGNKEWTKGTVDINVHTPTTVSGVSKIDMLNSPIEGRNLIKNSGLNIRLTKDSPFVGTQDYLHLVDGIDLTETFLGKDTTFSYYQHSIGERENSPRISLGEEIRSRFGIHGAIIYRDSKSTKPDKVVYPFASNLNSRTDNKRVSQTQRMEHYDYDKLVSYSLAVQPYAKPAQSNDEEWVLKDAKLEIGKQATPYTPAPEDIELIDGKKTYPVASNGVYTFKTTYNNGTTSESSVNVTNIDRENPTLTVEGNKSDWTEDDFITLNINAKDTQSGVKSITLPDGTVVNGTRATYKATENKEYTFVVTDNVGNTTTHKETVNRLMIPYTFYIYDSNGNPVEGSEYELYRDGTLHGKAKSDKSGLVDFGKVPPTGKYTIKQTKAPDGYVVNPDEKEVDVGDATEPEEFISYPRGKELPGTGTNHGVIYSLGLTTLAGILLYTIKKKKQINN